MRGAPQTVCIEPVKEVRNRNYPASGPKLLAFYKSKTAKGAPPSYHQAREADCPMQDKTKDSNELSRRALIRRAIFAIPALIGGTLAACVGSYVFAKQKNPQDNWADAGDMSELEPGAPSEIRYQRAVVDGWTVRAQEASAWVVIDDRRQITAFSPSCPHLGCAYGWQADKKKFVCPCHGSEFTLQGDVIKGPARRPLDRCSTKVEGKRLWLGPVKNSQDG
jgi:menaquinol-cytochrome c reductase iron-sulfur subunit